MAATPPICDFGWPAPAFSLPGIDGRVWSLEEIRGDKGTLVMFICNHCPYVVAVLDRLIADVKTLATMGIGTAAICSNDAVSYPADRFDKMVELAEDRGFPFPYLHDEDQSIARAYDAVCTPDFFGFDASLGLQYRGRLDAGRLGSVPDTTRRDLVEAMRLVVETGRGPEDQIASMGCSIKWKAA
ncbi:MAG: thioredoxin family protein [Pseudomonadota bacterium]